MEHFFLVLYFVVSVIGFMSFVVFGLGIYALMTDEKAREHCGLLGGILLFGGWLFIVLPVSLNLAEGNQDFLFHLGSTTIALLGITEAVMTHVRPRRAEGQRVQVIAPRQAGTVIEHAPARAQAMPAYAPPPAAISDDFDVPPQR